MKKKLKSKLLRVLLTVSLGLLLFTGCQKDLTNPSGKISVKGSSDFIVPTSFNWEGTDPNFNWMPQPPGKDPIPTVWTGASDIDPEILKDCKSMDGWVLVYSTFTYDINNYSQNPYYILYNKYRGIMRVFLYVNSVSGIANSTYLQDGIDLKTTSYSLLNFNGVDVADVSQNKSRFDKAEPKPVSGPPFANLKWYMLQYEFAYDPNIVATTDAHPPQFWFYVNSVNIDSVRLGGTQQGTLNGTIGSSSSSSTNLFSNVANTLGKPLGTGALAAVGSNFFENHYDPTLGLGLTGSNNNLGLSNSVFESIRNGVNSALSTAAGNLPGAITNIFSAIIGGSSATPQTVSLNLSTTINLKGSISSSFSFPSSPIPNYIPGSLKDDGTGNYNVVGYVPLYNQPLGVFNLKNRPIIKDVRWFDFYPIWDEYGEEDNEAFYGHDQYTVDPTSINIIWNPAVTSVATISNIHTEVVLNEDNSHWANIPVMGGGSGGSSGGKEEKLGSTRVWTGTTLTSWLDCSFLVFPDTYVRISFNVTPNNGAPMFTIIKTFKADVSTTWGNDTFNN
ncbi:MAG TPA: hypothetical protein VIH57_21295 [Bacteroidales bacterium]